MKKSLKWSFLLILQFSFGYNNVAYGQGTIWVPVKVHILQKSDGTVDIDKKIDMETINAGFAYANRKFKDSGVQFFICEKVNVNDDLWYSTSFNAPTLPWITYSGRNLPANPTALNLYLVPKITRLFPLIDKFFDGIPGGLSAFPEVDKLTNSHLFVRMSSFVNKPFFCYTLTHELGHIFYLKHTFDNNTNEQEKINRTGYGANCDAAGDAICDTNADFFPSYTNDIHYNTLTGELYYNGKYIENGVKYNPPLNNLMSYYYGYKYFSDRIHDNFNFTSQQILRIKSYANLRANKWTATNLGCFLAIFHTFPSLSKPTSSIINWSHSSNIETGYFIERATNLEPTKFECVGGVAPNIFTFNDTIFPIPKNVSRVYYRIIPSNAKGLISYSNVEFRDIPLSISITNTSSLSTNFFKSPNNQKNLSIIDICKNELFPVIYTSQGAFASNNLFKIQLSDQNGYFGANPLVIGSNTSSPIIATIPNLSFPTGNYKIRVVSTNPMTTSSASTDSYNILPTIISPTLSATPRIVPLGNSTILSATGCSGTVNWSFNKLGSVQIITPLANTTFTAYCKNTCKSDDASISITSSNSASTDNITYMEYYFDIDPGFGNGTSVNVSANPIIETNIPINISTLSQGVHILNVRIKTNTNKWSVTNSQTIFVGGTGNTSKIVKLEYFYDTDPGYDNGIPINISPDSSVFLDTRFSMIGLSDGFHVLYMRAKDGANRWSNTEQIPVMVMSTGKGIGLMSSLEYFIDTDPGLGNGTSLSFTPQADAKKQFNINLSNVSEGVHVVYVRVKDDLNRWSTLHSQVFVKIPNTLTKQIVQAEYYIDTDPGQGNATPFNFSPNPSQEIFGNIAVSANSMSKGTHTIFVRAKDSGNLWSSIASTTFDVESIPCPPVAIIDSPIQAVTTQAMERIFSTSKIETGINANYQAGNSVLLSPGFETKSNVRFKVTISGCVND